MVDARGAKLELHSRCSHRLRRGGFGIPTNMGRRALTIVASRTTTATAQTPSSLRSKVEPPTPTTHRTDTIVTEYSPNLDKTRFG